MEVWYSTNQYTSWSMHSKRNFSVWSYHLHLVQKESLLIWLSLFSFRLAHYRTVSLLIYDNWKKKRNRNLGTASLYFKRLSRKLLRPSKHFTKTREIAAFYGQPLQRNEVGSQLHCGVSKPSSGAASEWGSFLTLNFKGEIFLPCDPTKGPSTF